MLAHRLKGGGCLADGSQAVALQPGVRQDPVQAPALGGVPLQHASQQLIAAVAEMRLPSCTDEQQLEPSACDPALPPAAYAGKQLESATDAAQLFDNWAAVKMCTCSLMAKYTPPCSSSCQ